MLSGWLWKETGARNTNIDFDIESTPLQIQTDSVLGSGDVMWIRFVELNSDTGPGITIKFSDPAYYAIGRCGDETFTLPGTEKYRVWTFTKQDNTLQLLCNGVEIYSLNYLESGASDECKTMWSKDFGRMIFSSSSAENGLVDNASDFYRQLGTG